MNGQGSIQMVGSSPSLAYRLGELRGLAAGLRVERALARRNARRGPSRVRLALGAVFLQLGVALAARPTSNGIAR